MKKQIMALILALSGFTYESAAQDLLPVVSSHLQYSGRIYGTVIEGDCLFLSTQNQGLVVYDIVNIEEPRIINSQSESHLSLLSIWNNKLCGVSQKELQVFDISEPTDLRLIGSLTMPFPITSYAFSDSLCIVSSYDQVSFGNEMVFDYSCIRIFNITDIDNPELLFNLNQDTYFGFETTQFGSMVIRDHYLDTSDGPNEYWGADNSNIWDISNPSEIRMIGDFEDVGSTLTLLEDDKLIGTNRFGANLFSIRNPQQPELISSFAPEQIIDCVVFDTLLAVIKPDTTIEFHSALSIDEDDIIGSFRPAFRYVGLILSYTSGLVFTAEGFLEFLDLSDITTPRVACSIDTRGNIDNAKKFGDLLFTFGEEIGVVISDYSNPSMPTILSKIMIARPNDIAVVGQYGFVATLSNGVAIIDLTNPPSPQLIGRILEREGLFAVQIVSDTLLYVGCRFDCKIFDISDPESPALIRTLQDGGVTRIDSEHDRLYSSYSGGVTAYDISDLVNPRKLSPFQVVPLGNDRITRCLFINQVGFIQRAWSREDILGVVLDVVDYSQPDSARLIRTFAMNNAPLGIGYLFPIGDQIGTVIGDTLFTYHWNRFTPPYISLWGSYQLERENERAAFIDEALLYTITAGQVVVYDSELLTASGGTEIHQPSTFSLSAFPNPFNSTLTIRFTGGLESAATRLAIYDISGREVADLFSGKFTPPTPPAISRGAFQTVTWDATSIGAGVYFVRLEADDKVTTQKIVLMR